MQTEKKSMFSGLVDLVITKDDNIPTKAPQKTTTSKSTTTTAPSTPAVPAYNPPPITVMPSNSDPRVAQFKQTLEASIQEKALGSFDYLKLKAAADQLQAYIPREPDRINAAFKSARSSNPAVTKQKILESTEHYLSVLEQEKNEFDRSVDAQNQEKVVNIEQQIQAAEQSLAQKQEQIKHLMDEVNELNKQKMDLGAQLNEGKAKISDWSNSFSVAYNTVEASIKQDIQKISDYITE